MPRITPVRTKDQVEEQYYGVFDAIAESRGEVRGPFSLLMHSPELAGRAAHLGAYIRFEGALDNATMETAIISAAREFNCGYEWGAHVAMARQAGVPETTIAAIRDRRNGDLPDDVRLVVDFAQRLVREKGRIDETTLKAIETESLKGFQGELDPLPSQDEEPPPPVALGALFRPPWLMRIIVGSVTLMVINAVVHGFVIWMPTFFILQGMSMVAAFQFALVMSLGAPIGEIGRAHV